MKSNKNLIAGITVLGIIGVAAFFISQNGSAPGKYDDFAGCLSDKGVKMYGAYWCPACKQQKTAFAKSFAKINYIECSLPNRGGQRAECVQEGIAAYPTWEFSGGKKISGVLSLKKLSELSGCELK